MSRHQVFYLLVLGGLMALAGGAVLFLGGGPGDRGEAVELEVGRAPGGEPGEEDLPGRQPEAAPPASEPRDPLDLRVTLDVLEDMGGEKGVARLLLGAVEPQASSAARFELAEFGEDPQEGASVSFLAGPNAGLTARSLRGGVVTARGLVPGKHVVRIQVGSRAPFHRMLRVRPGGESVNRFDADWRGGGVLVVRVTDAGGAPIPGQRVWADGVRETTDEEGLARFGGLVPGFGVPLRVVAEGFTAVERPTEVPAAGELEFHVRLVPGGSVRGRAMVPPGDPDPALLYVLPPPGTGTSVERSFPFHLDGVYSGLRLPPDGSFEVKGLPVDSTVRLVARHPRFSMTRPVAVRPAGPDSSYRSSRPVILAPVAGGPVTGTVVTPRGEPVPGALVRSRAAGRSLRPGSGLFQALETLGFSGREFEAYLLSVDVLRLHEAQAVTGEEGTFLVGRPDVGATSLLEVTAPGFLPATRTVGPGGTPELSFVLEPLEEGVSGAGLNGEGPVVVLAFQGNAGRRDRLRVTVGRDGVQREPAFLWDTGRPLELPLASPARVALRGVFEQGGKPLGSFSRTLAVTGRLKQQVELPPGR